MRSKKKTAKKITKKTKTIYYRPEYTKATKSMPPMVGKKFLFTMTCDAETVKGLNAFQKDNDLDNRSVAGRTALKQFFKSKGYIK